MKLTVKWLIATYCLILSPVTLAVAANEANSHLASKPVNNRLDKRIHNKLTVKINFMQFDTLTEKPYLALWYSLPNKHYTPLKVLRADSKWLRDLKSFWRYIARYQRERLDGITSATVKSGKHSFSFALPKTTRTQTHGFWVEVARENGSRELLKINMQPGQQTQTCIEGTKEISLFCVDYQ
ncbi:DUF2271 domain-containing protein [Shewanella gelidimarina]|uniref:DUF2271 domain-containing protein n=1 Tax=Shewanella gelidimarina TaxID=56813 RepID=UPI00200CB615|nr:DUF2271 domain-containing protein [Shewanella gelidimarina]MCL1058070.1 DUF2271 domain-containing protein [Shewanella gelidimarina]